MASRGAAPPPSGHWPSRFPPSPRKHQQLARLPASVPASSSTAAATGRRRSQHKRGSGPGYPSVALLEAAAATPPGSPNPQVAAIQARVADLVRQYDDAVAAEEEEEEQGADGGAAGFDDDGGFAMAPTRWRVGDVLLATHSALARTSTRTERAMVAEFADDPEVKAAVGGGARVVGEELELAVRQAARRHERLAHIQQALHHVAMGGGGAFADSESDEDEDAASVQKQSLSARERQMRTTMDAMHREKAAVVAQLQEALRTHREAGVASERQAQELAKAQRSLRSQSEELRLVHEASDRAAEAAHASTASWRDKYQASTKAAAAAEAKAQELEEKVRAQAEELAKHELVLQAKMQEVESHKESEAARHRAEMAAHAQALAEAEAETKRAKAKALEEKRNAAKAGADTGGSSKEMRMLEDKARSLQAALTNTQSAAQELQAENAQLEERVRDLQTRLAAARKSSRAGVEPAAPALVTRPSFALRLREASARRLSARKSSASMSAVVAAATRSVPEESAEDALSSDSEEDEAADVGGSTVADADDAEVVQDERELNLALQRVVATVFPSRARATASTQSDASLGDSIARFEDPACSPLGVVQSAVATREDEGSADGMVPRSALEKLRGAHEKALNALQHRYVDSLVEYKTLVLEQYERRQASERERHRLEIEGLLGLVQTKFHAELARRSEHLRRTKEALKVLYRGLRQHDGDLKTARVEEEAVVASQEPADASLPSPPLKTLLRAAILAMSSSRKRSERGTNQISAMYDQLVRPAPADPRTSALASAMTIHAVLPELDDEATRSVACQTEEDARPLRTCTSTAAGRSTASSSADSLEGYVLPGTPCFPSRSNLHEPHEPQLQASANQNQLHASASASCQGLSAPPTLHLVQGASMSPPLVTELRRRLPGLPPGAYYVSAQLRMTLFRELVRFYATLEPPPSPVDEPGEHVETRAAEPPMELLGSPRDTPFMRRKALEALASGARRRHRFASQGAAILQTALAPGGCR